MLYKELKHVKKHKLTHLDLFMRILQINLGVQGGVEILGNGINFGLNKEVIWETAKTTGYTKIKSKCYTPCYHVADNAAVYVTIFCEGINFRTMSFPSNGEKMQCDIQYRRLSLFLA